MTNHHARLAPSSAAQWVPCPASVKMSEKHADAIEPGEAAREGTAAHWALSEHLQGRPITVGSFAPNGCQITDAMVDGAQLVVAVAPQFLQHGILSECRVDVPEVHPSDCWGTLDLGTVDFAAKRLEVLDYKFGFSFVPAYENWQGVLYLAGLRELVGADLSWSYRVTVVQPRWYGAGEQHRSWTITGPELAHYESVAARSAAQTELIVPPANTGLHCRHCDARHACAALQASAAAAVEIARDMGETDLDPAATGTEIAILQAASERLKARLTALEQLAIGQIRRGQSVPGWMLDRTKPRERWAVPEADVVALGTAIGVALGKPATVTPSQARKAGVPQEILAAYCETPTGELKLVPMAGAAIRAFTK